VTHVHIAGAVYGKDETNHWSLCDTDSQVVDGTTEAHTWAYTNNNDGTTHTKTCTICGYKVENEAHAYTGGVCACTAKEAKTYTVTVNAGSVKHNNTIALKNAEDAETTVTETTAGAGATYTLPEIPSIQYDFDNDSWAYVFLGWKVGDREELVNAGTNITVTGDTKITGQWALYSINGDKKWDSTDVSLLMSYIAHGGSGLDNEQLLLADVNTDDKIDSADVSNYMSKIARSQIAAYDVNGQTVTMY
jgi:hypothetical protein